MVESDRGNFFDHTLITPQASVGLSRGKGRPASTQNQLVTAGSDHIGQRDSGSIPVSATNSSITYSQIWRLYAKNGGEVSPS